MPNEQEIQRAREILQQGQRRQMEHMHREAEAERQRRQQQYQQYQFEERMEQLPMALAGMDDQAEEGLEEAPPMRQETRRERKKREEQEKADMAYLRQMEKAEDLETDNEVIRTRAAVAEGTMVMDKKAIRREKKIMEEKLKAVSLREKADMLELEGLKDKQAELEVRWPRQVDRAEIWRDYARMLPVGTFARAEAMERKEEEEIKADKLRKRLRVMQIENVAEREREEKTLARHAKYDMLKEIFRDDNPLSHEDSTYIIHRPGQADLHLVNVGRAFFGGTKPMYIFEDRNAPRLNPVTGEITGYEQYLFKEAVNCIGFKKPEGALVTAAASRLQEIICGPYSIPAYRAVHNGKVLGSFQKKIDTAPGAPDLFKWQANPESRENMPTDTMREEILREHTLDWLLCNFDTKGENFLHRTDGHLCSFDKEASFSKLMDPEAAHMSTTYKPHANETLYNVLFREYAAGRKTLELQDVIDHIVKAEQIPDEEYLGMFDEMLTQKYGKRSESNAARVRAEQAMLARKTGLREEYRRFFTELVLQRRENRLAAGQGDDTADLLSENGRFRFRGEA